MLIANKVVVAAQSKRPLASHQFVWLAAATSFVDTSGAHVWQWTLRALFRKVAENPSWDWYTKQITEIKSPKDGFDYIVGLAGGRWQFQDHVWETVQATLHTGSNLAFMGISPGGSDEATKALSLTLHIVLNRMWTMSKHSLPPDCYAAVASRFANIADQACATLREHNENLLVLEDVRHTNASAEALWADLALIAQAKPTRTLFEFFAATDTTAGLSLVCIY